ncbi:TPA: hypothetical protein GX533_01635 [Candidatus Dojkabacteria bacterium]|jgi:hypothetical protein|uniref:Uncharacterized protein n=1 Tax=Candidatus Dojkabacteria bacterium TaxID=2099670 RepID=A0A832QF50_9BACT|nr:hypothetical protein [Candidatus Dojkabacteria bacterium]
MEKKDKEKKGKKNISATVSVFFILGLTFSLLSIMPDGGTYLPLGLSFLAIGIADLFETRRKQKE